jgi:hypothetical protein
MKKEIYMQLLEWKLSARRKPLLLRGARQTGKTYIKDGKICNLPLDAVSLLSTLIANGGRQSQP